MIKEYPSFNQVLEAQNKCILMQIEHWREHELYSVQFWLLMALLTIPWIIWWKVVDKRRLLEIFIYGLLISIAATTLDEIGCQLNLWEYRYDVEPLFPRLVSMNFTMLPIAYMLIYQYFPEWKTFIYANIVWSAIAAFIGEPVFIMLGIYELLIWKSIYSFPIYFILAIIIKSLVNWIMRVQKSAL